jgi:hypothetical protein
MRSRIVANKFRVTGTSAAVAGARMPPMKLQFNTATLLLATAWGAIALGGGLAGWRAEMVNNSQATPVDLVKVLVFTSPWWMPFVFAAYALGKGRLTVKTTIAFAIAEGAGLAGMISLI